MEEHELGGRGAERSEFKFELSSNSLPCSRHGHDGVILCHLPFLLSDEDKPGMMMKLTPSG